MEVDVITLRSRVGLQKNILRLRELTTIISIVSLTYENERISVKKKQLTLLKIRVTSLLCGPRADIWQAEPHSMAEGEVAEIWPRERLQKFATFDSLSVRRSLEAR